MLLISVLSVQKVCSPLTQASLQPHPANLKLLLLMVMKVFCCTAVSRSISWRPILTTWKFVTSCWMVKNRLRNSMTNLKLRWPVIPWSTSRLPVCSTLSVATHIQWQSCVVLPARWRRSITTRWMLTILVIVKLPRSACCRKCRPWPRCVTSIPLVSHLFIRATISPMPVTSWIWCSPRRANRMKLIRFWNVLWTVFWSCTLTMNRTPLPPPCVPLALRVRTRLPVSQQVLLHCGDLRTVVLTKRRWKCWKKLAPLNTFRNLFVVRKIKMILSAWWASVTACTKITTRAPP